MIATRTRTCEEEECGGEGEEEEEGFDDDQIEVDAATIDGGR